MVGRIDLPGHKGAENYPYYATELYCQGKLLCQCRLLMFNELGHSIMLDHITRAFKIEVEGAPVWDTNAPGFVCLPEIHEVK